MVIRPDKNDYDYAVYADVGPVGKIGKASMALADALGIPSNPKFKGYCSWHHLHRLPWFGERVGRWIRPIDDMEQRSWPVGPAG